MLIITYFLVFCSPSPKYVVCCNGYTDANCTFASLKKQLALQESTLTEADFTFLKKASLTDGKVSADATDLYLAVNEMNDQISLDLSLVSSLINLNLNIISSKITSIDITITSPASNVDMNSLNIHNCTVGFQNPVQFKTVLFDDDGCLKPTLEAINRKVSMVNTMTCDIKKAKKYYDITLSQKLTITAEIDISIADQSIKFIENGVSIRGNPFFIGTNYIPVDKYDLKPQIKFPTSSKSKSIIFGTESVVRINEITITPTGITAGKTLPVKFDDVWDNLREDKSVTFIVSELTDIKIVTTRKNAITKIMKSDGVIFYQYPVSAQSVYICFNSSNKDCTSGISHQTANIIAEYYTRAPTQADLTVVLSSLKADVTTVEIFLVSPENTLDLSVLVSKTVNFLKFTADTVYSIPPSPARLLSNIALTLSTPPVGVYKWKVTNIDITLKAETIVSSNSDPLDSAIVGDTLKLLFYDSCTDSDGTSCKNLQFAQVIYQPATLTLSSDFTITFNPKGYTIGSQELVIGKEPTNYNTKKIVVSLDFGTISEGCGIKLKASGESGPNLELTISISGTPPTSFPITFSEWDSFNSNVKVDITVPDSNAKIFVVNGTPLQKVTMKLKDQNNIVYDMLPFSSDTTCICIGTASQCVNDLGISNLFFKIVSDSTKANEFIKRINKNQEYFCILPSTSIDLSSALNFSLFTGSINKFYINNRVIAGQSLELNLILKSNTINIGLLDLTKTSLSITSETADGKLSIKNFIQHSNLEKIDGMYQISNIESNIDNLAIFQGVKSSRFFVNVVINNADNYLLVGEESWTIGTGTDIKANGKLISPSNETYFSDAFFFKLEVTTEANITVFPKTQEIQRSLPLSIFAIKGAISASGGYKLHVKQSVLPKATFNFDSMWGKVVMKEQFVIRFIGDSTLLFVDDTNVNENVMIVKQVNALPDQTEDAKQLDPKFGIDQPTPTPKKEFSTGAFVGIVVGVVAVVAVIVFSIVFFIKKKKKAKIDGNAEA